MKTKAQIELEISYKTIMDVLKRDDICLVNQTNRKSLQFYKNSGLWIIKDELGVSLSKRFVFEEALKELVKL